MTDDTKFATKSVHDKFELLVKKIKENDLRSASGLEIDDNDKNPKNEDGV